MFAAFATMVDERKVVACDFMCRIASTKYLNSLGTTGLSEDSESRQVHVFHFGKLIDSRIHINSAKTNAFCLPRNCIPNRRLTLRIFNCQNIFDFVDFLFTQYLAVFISTVLHLTQIIFQKKISVTVTNVPYSLPVFGQKSN